MKTEELDNRYFDWMCQLVYNENARYLKADRYTRLFRKLDSIPFRYSIPMDSNRSEDGIELRYRFGQENNIDDRVIASELDVGECSVFEMIIALAVRCENQIMHDDDLGDRTSMWFWEMLANLDLTRMDNRHFDEQATESIVNRFLDRRYNSHGEGSLFSVQNPPRDMRDVEIWYQMCWYLNELEPSDYIL